METQEAVDPFAVEDASKKVLELNVKIEALQRETKDLARKISDERLENGVLHEVIDKLIDKLARG